LAGCNVRPALLLSFGERTDNARKELLLMRNRILLAVGLLALVPVAAGAWGHKVPPPEETVFVGELNLELYPFTTNDFEQAYDPINFILIDVDPREVRQAFLGLSGQRGMNHLPFGQCTWADAMGSEQAAWAEVDGWVGGEVQLVCINPLAPSPLRELGDPFRVHVRLYREGDVTLGAAHFEVLIPWTAQHEVLSWDFAQFFVGVDLGRAGLQPALLDPVVLQTEPDNKFRAIRRAVYDGLIKANPAVIGLLSILGVYPPPGPGDVPIPLAGLAPVLTGDLPFDPIQEKIHTQIDVPYDITVPRPFCLGGPTDYVQLQGSLTLSLDVHTNPSGKYERRHQIAGTLWVTPLGSTDSEPALIWEDHRALLTDHYGQLWEKGSQELQGAAPQSLQWRLDAGQRDRYRERETCGP
jgi:hypothetical protein